MRLSTLTTACVLAVCAGWLGSSFAAAPARGAGRVPMALRGASLRISLGLKDKDTTPWDGRIQLSAGRVSALKALMPRAAKVQGNSWKLRTRKPRAVVPKKKRRRQGAIVRPVLMATLDAPPSARVTVSTKQGDFSFLLSDLQLGESKTFLNGQVRVARLPLSVRLTVQPTDDDWPSAAVAPDGAVWVAYMAYQRGPALNVAAIHGERKFDGLVPTGNGDQVRLLKFDGEAWGAPINVTGQGLDVWRPAVAVDGKGTVWVIWSQNISGNWDVHARSYDPSTGQWRETRRLTTAPGADVYAVAATDPKTGTVAVVWQGWRDGNFDILMTSLPGGKESVVAATPANDWSPAAVFDSKGTLHVAFDTYEKGNYDVRLVSGANLGKATSVEVAASPRFEARPSLAVDKADRVWVAFEQGGPNWGKDFGTRWGGRSGEQFYLKRTIVVRCVQGGQVRQVMGQVPAAPVSNRYPAGRRRRINVPRLTMDTAGRLWLFYRQHPLPSGGGERWTSFATYHTGREWSAMFPLANSANQLDNRPALVPLKDGGVLVIHSTDGRTRGTKSAKQNDLYGAVARALGEVKAPELVALPPAGEPVKPVHPKETEEVRRVREYRATIGGKAYQLLRGEFHRHTELTSHRDQDGLLEEIWRYGLDVAAMDWIGNGDHDNGYGVEYLWWTVQKQTDIFYHPPQFVPMFTYERSVVYPSGHRNVMFAKRGIRPLPRIGGGRARLFGTPEKGSPDIKTLYAYLRHFDGICASHTSATNMGTDWRDWGGDVEPIVEIYQGHRQNYEHDGAPGSAKNAKDSIGGYRPAGFVWNAWQKGYRLGIQVSSDHVSTHLSYAIVYAEGPTREAILDAFKKRHCYGANDNIILDVRCGNHMMGDIFQIKGKPTFEITAVGTQPIAHIAIVRGVGSDVPRYVYNGKPDKARVKFTWTDESPAYGKTAYYYVRIEQKRPKTGAGALAWASPMWITAEQ